MTLIEFLRARLGERREVVVYATGRLPFPVSSPAEMLAECEAKLRIVETATEAQCMAEDWAKSDMREALFTSERRDTYAEVLRALALPYADHPDYREEWKP